MLIREAIVLDEIDHIDPPHAASSTIFISLNNTQLK